MSEANLMRRFSSWLALEVVSSIRTHGHERFRSKNNECTSQIGEAGLSNVGCPRSLCPWQLVGREITPDIVPGITIPNNARLSVMAPRFPFLLLSAALGGV